MPSMEPISVIEQTTEAVIKSPLPSSPKKVTVEVAKSNGHNSNNGTAEPTAAVAQRAAAPGTVDSQASASETTADAAVAVAVAPAKEERAPPIRSMYFVRVPKPVHVDDTLPKKLQQELHATLTKLRGINTAMQPKRAEIQSLRKQLKELKDVRDATSQEFEATFRQLKELNALKGRASSGIRTIRDGPRGLEVRSEQELDERVRQLEHRISHDQVELREEKQLVQQISKLKQQREAVREAESKRGGLEPLQEDLAKIMGDMTEVETHYKLLKAERDQARDISAPLQVQLEQELVWLKALEEERGELERLKQDLQEQLQRANQAVDAVFEEHKLNRRFSLQVRDLVQAGRVEDAVALCAEQVETAMSKLASDAKYRAEYKELWAGQRKYVVSALLPDSGTPLPGMLPSQGGRPARPLAPPPKPQGAQKAQAIIAAAMQSAQTEVAALREAKPEPDEAKPEAAEATATAATVEPPPPAGPVRRPGDDFEGAPDQPRRMPQRSKPAPRPEQQFAKYLAELPKVAYDEGFVAPVAKPEPEQKLSAAEIKDKIREENRVKAAEAEVRKKRRQESNMKKKLQRQEQQSLQKQVAGGAAAKPADGSTDEDPEPDAPDAAEPERRAPPTPAPAAPSSSRAVVATPQPQPPRPKRRNKNKQATALAWAKGWASQNQGMAAAVAVVAAFVVLWLLWLLISLFQK